MQIVKQNCIVRIYYVILLYVTMFFMKISYFEILNMSQYLPRLYTYLGFKHSSKKTKRMDAIKVQVTSAVSYLFISFTMIDMSGLLEKIE